MNALMPPARPQIGLGADSVVKSIEIHWPSGIVQKLNDVRAHQILTVDEPVASAKP
jgi:enediyne biosynthesis protein E4